MAERWQFFAGDEIRIEVEFQHKANISHIAATFSNDAEGGHDTVEFWELREGNPSIYRANKDTLTTESRAVLYAEVSGEHRASTYRCVLLTATTAGGKEINFSRLPDLSFEVIPEPGSAPALQGFKIRDPAQDSDIW